MPLLFAQGNGSALALACSAAWTKRSVGYVGTSDGWQDLKAHHQMTWEYTRAENGNVALTAEIDLSKSQGDFVLALGFGKDAENAAGQASASLRNGFDKAKHDCMPQVRTPTLARPRNLYGRHTPSASASAPYEICATRRSPKTRGPECGLPN